MIINDHQDDRGNAHQTGNNGSAHAQGAHGSVRASTHGCAHGTLGTFIRQAIMGSLMRRALMGALVQARMGALMATCGFVEDPEKYDVLLVTQLKRSRASTTGLNVEHAVSQVFRHGIGTKRRCCPILHSWMGACLQLTRQPAHWCSNKRTTALSHRLHGREIFGCAMQS